MASDVDNQPQSSSRRSKEPAAAEGGRAREEGLRQFEPVSSKDASPPSTASNASDAYTTDSKTSALNKPS